MQRLRLAGGVAGRETCPQTTQSTEVRIVNPRVMQSWRQTVTTELRMCLQLFLLDPCLVCPHHRRIDDVLSDDHTCSSLVRITSLTSKSLVPSSPAPPRDAPSHASLRARFHAREAHARFERAPLHVLWAAVG